MGNLNFDAKAFESVRKQIEENVNQHTENFRKEKGLDEVPNFNAALTVGTYAAIGLAENKERVTRIIEAEDRETAKSTTLETEGGYSTELNYEYQLCSEVAKKIMNSETKEAKPKRIHDKQFEGLKLGCSFFVPFGKIKEQYLRNICSTQSKRFKCIFRCIKHNDTEFFEVARVA